MISSLEVKIKMLLSVHHILLAQMGFLSAQRIYSKDSFSNEQKRYTERIACLISGSHGLLRLITEEDAYILELHLIRGLKWQLVIYEYEKQWPTETGICMRTYMNRQQQAIRKIADEVNALSCTIDFSWLDDPLIEQLAVRSQQS